jgi:hypothetical protein
MADSMIRKHYDLALSRHHSGESKEVLMEGVEAGLTGAALGFASASSKTGLDIGVGTMKAPIDLGIGVIGLGLSLAVPGERKLRESVRTVASTALGIGVFRKTEAFVKAKNAATAHGEIEEAFDDPDGVDMGADPVIRVARGL